MPTDIGAGATLEWSDRDSIFEATLAERTLRIFVSSPSDVAAERARVKPVADRLNGQLEGVVRLEVLRWEDAFYTAAHSFQEAIDGASATCRRPTWCSASCGSVRASSSIPRSGDARTARLTRAVRCWNSRLRSRSAASAPACPTSSCSANRRRWFTTPTASPSSLSSTNCCRRCGSAGPRATEGYNTAGYQSFADPDDFERKLEACLRQWLERRGVVAHGPVWDRKLQRFTVPRACSRSRQGHSSVFFGREAAIARAIAKLRHAPFLLVIGASGSGKSSLLKAGLVPRITSPGVIPDVDLWRTAGDHHQRRSASGLR